MNCVECRELLVGYIEKLLDAQQGETVRQHLKDCRQCRKELKQIMALQNRLAANGRLTNANDLENAVMDRIVREQAFKLRETNQDNQHANIWRLIMRSPITKLAMAAVVIITVGLAIYYFVGGGTKSCCAWPLIADKVAQIKTCVYRTHVRHTGGPPGLQMDINGITYLSSEYGSRSDVYTNGTLTMQMYMRTDDKVSVTLMPSEKKYMRLVLTDEMLSKNKNKMQDPRDMLTTFMTGQIKELGTKVIDNIEVKGMEVVDPPSFRGLYGSFIGRLWVDVATEYPVRIEIEMEMGTGAGAMKMFTVMDDFVWGEELDPGVFEPNIPADYTMMAEMKMPGQDEASAIEGLRAFAEMTNGRYPKQMNVMAMMQEATKAVTQSVQQAIIKDMNLAPGAKPSEAMRQELIDKAKKTSEAMQQELMNKMMKLQGICIFYAKLNEEGKEPMYYGDKVTPEFGDSVLMRWKTAENQYRVIFGNLTVKTVSPDELAALEAMPLNRQPKAIKPKPADGIMCSQITDLELSWMPGIYAATNKVYMGKAPDGLTLLADVADDSNVIVEELKRDTTYYWRVDGTDANGKTTTGDVWSFNTGKLVGWWKFDESTGTIASDNSGHGNNGTLKGNPVWRPTGGVSGGAIELSGKGEYVEIANEANFDINDQITVSAWVNIIDVPQEWTGIVTKGDSAWRLSTSLAQNIFHFGVSGSAYFNGHATVDSGQWHNVVGVYDGQKISIYVDGKLDVTDMQTGPIATNDFPVCIGENLEVKGRCFHGLIDDVRIYNYALSETEIVELYNSSH